MVEYSLPLDSVFHALSDSTRRDILRRVSLRTMTVGEIASHYPLTFAAISKHIRVLEAAHIIRKRRQGKEQHVSIVPKALADAATYLDAYRNAWEARLDSFEQYLKDTERSDKETK
jgi:DNA-binding transcriptional ArsR family regulator